MDNVQQDGGNENHNLHYRIRMFFKSRLSRIATLFVVAVLIIMVLLVPVKKTALFVPPQESIVNITDTGFEPQTIQIKQNTAITWVNTGSNAHQVAADPYPKDDSIPGFDSSQTLLVGDSLTFAFLNKGTYLLHDELNPLNFQATVAVTTEKEE